MKLTIGYDKLQEKLDFVTASVEDKLLDESCRNIIFRFTESGVMFVGYNQNVICKTHLDALDYSKEVAPEELKDGVAYMQIKSKELINCLSSFKTLNKTKPTEVIFETIKNKIRVIVVEEFIDTEKELKPQKSVWTFDNLVVKDNIAKEISIQVAGEQLEGLQSARLLLYINSLLPLVSDDGSNSLPSKLIFSDDYVCAVPSIFASLFKNQLPDAFKGITFGYSALNFLKKLLLRNDVVEVYKSELYLVIVAGDTEAFVRFNTKLPNTEVYLRNFNKEHAIVIDRLYTKDVLKRLSLLNENAEMSISLADGVLKVKNSKFSQDIPLLATKDMESLGEVKFKLATQIAMKAIIGDDATFTQESSELRIYIVPVGNSFVLNFTDASDMWFSTVQVK